MAIELVTSLFLILCANMISRLIERRRDVLYYVSRSDPPRIVRGFLLMWSIFRPWSISHSQ